MVWRDLAVVRLYGYCGERRAEFTGIVLAATRFRSWLPIAVLGFLMSLLADAYLWFSFAVLTLSL